MNRVFMGASLGTGADLGGGGVGPGVGGGCCGRLSSGIRPPSIFQKFSKKCLKTSFVWPVFQHFACGAENWSKNRVFSYLEELGKSTWSTLKKSSTKFSKFF